MDAHVDQCFVTNVDFKNLDRSQQINWNGGSDSLQTRKIKLSGNKYSRGNLLLNRRKMTMMTQMWKTFKTTRNLSSDLTIEDGSTKHLTFLAIDAKTKLPQNCFDTGITKTPFNTILSSI